MIPIRSSAPRAFDSVRQGRPAPLQPRNNNQPKLSEMGTSALWYARHGIPVFPLHTPVDGKCSCGNPECGSIGKHPRTKNGFLDSTTDINQVMMWWSQWPDANIGIPTGAKSGFDVLDNDPRNGGAADREEFIRRYGPIPETAEVTTGQYDEGIGRHLYFRYGGTELPKSIAPGLDLKGDGGYVAAPPSLHWTGKRYEVDGLAGANALLTVAEKPRWLLDLISTARNGTRTKPTAGGDKWPQGERNNGLTSLAGTMQRRGMSLQAITAALLEENRRRCDPPLPEGEVRQIAESISRYEPGEERRHQAHAEASGGEWPKPEPMQDELPPVQAFSEDLLPESFRPLVADVAERMQVPMDYPGVMVVLGLAGAVSRRAVIQPKARDTGWAVVPNLWGGIIAPPGFMKSPVIQAVTRPLHQLQASWCRAHEAAKKDYRREGEIRASTRGVEGPV